MIWEQIFVLLNTVSEHKIRQAKKDHAQCMQSVGTLQSVPESPEQIDFCEVNPSDSSLVYKPAEI